MSLHRYTGRGFMEPITLQVAATSQRCNSRYTCESLAANLLSPPDVFWFTASYLLLPLSVWKIWFHLGSRLQLRAPRLCNERKSYSSPLRKKSSNYMLCHKESKGRRVVRGWRWNLLISSRCWDFFFFFFNWLRMLKWVFSKGAYVCVHFRFVQKSTTKRTLDNDLRFIVPACLIAHVFFCIIKRRTAVFH